MCIRDSDLDRALQGATTQAGVYGDDQNRDLQRQLDAADRVAGYEAGQDQNLAQLADFANPAGRYLREFQSTILPALIQSSGSSSSKGFGLPSITA